MTGFLAWTGGLFLGALAIAAAGMAALFLSGAVRPARREEDGREEDRRNDDEWWGG